VLRVDPPGARVDRHDCVAAVVLAREERILLEAAELGADRLDRGRDLVRHALVHLEQLDGVVVLALEALVPLDAAGQARMLGRAGRPRRSTRAPSRSATSPPGSRAASAPRSARWDTCRRRSPRSRARAAGEPAAHSRPPRPP